MDVQCVSSGWHWQRYRGQQAMRNRCKLRGAIGICSLCRSPFLASAPYRCFALKVFIFVAAGQRQGRGLPHFQPIIASRLSSLFCAIPRVSIALRRDRFESGCSSTKVSTVSHERLLRRLQSTERNGVYVKNKSLYIKKGIMVDLRDVFWFQGRGNVLVEFQFPANRVQVERNSGYKFVVLWLFLRH